MIHLLLALAFQCSDGSPPPCARAVPAPTASAPDPHRIAVLPFRVTTADSLLGEGLAELIATEFNGESAPRAVNMGTVIRAWRTAGGGLRSPLAQDRAIRLVRGMGAGRYVDGSVVGLGSRLTINASVVSVNGDTRAAPSVSGSADSLDVLVGRIASGLLASAGSDPNAATRVRLTDSPAAMRAYIEGLAHWRAGRLAPAAAAFERAMGEDSLFARAIFMRWSVGQWQLSAPQGLDRRLLALLDRLSPADRELIVARFGDGTPRTRSASLAARQAGADHLPESAEAQYFLADFLYHYGRALDIADNLSRARVVFERSIALDSQATVLQHLLEIALVSSDTALALQVFPGYDRASGNAWDWGMAVAAMTGDRGMYAAQKRRAQPVGSRVPVIYLLGDVVLPAAARDEIREMVVPTAPNFAAYNGATRFIDATVAGRPSAARVAALMELPAAQRQILDIVIVVAAIDGEGDKNLGTAALERMRLALTDSNAVARWACFAAHWEFAFGGGLRWDDAALRIRDPNCAAVVDAVKAVRDHSPDAHRLLLLGDAAARNFGLGEATLAAMAMTRAWEQAGDLPRALGMARMRNFGVASYPSEAARVRNEGRLAALTGDTVGAIRAYQRYLGLRQDAEAPLIPQRDSVRAELSRLQGR